MKRALQNSSSSFQENGKKSCLDSTNNKPVIKPLFSALKQHADLDSIKRILCDIDDVNVGYGYYNRSPLHHAVSWNCDLGIIEELILRGANINSRDKIGMTPLHLAVTSNKDSEYVPRLLGLGADVNARNHSKETPLYLAISQFKKINIIKMLLEHGADTDYVYDDFLSSLGFFTILDKTVVLGAVEPAKLLIKIIFLKNFVKDFSKVVELKEDPRINTDILSKFMVRCIREIVLMQKTKINSTYSVFDFALFGNNHNLKPLYTDTLIIDSELNLLFPIYHDIIQQNIGLALQRGQCINQFRDLQTYRISSRSDTGTGNREVTLNFDCIEKICTYLTNQELLNFTQAFQVSLQILK